MSSRSTIARGYSWSRGKALQTPSITGVTKVGSMVHQAFCGSHQSSWGLVLPRIISHWYALSTRGCPYPESFVNGVSLGLTYITKQRSWCRFVCPNCSLALISNHEIRMCSFAFGSIYEPYSIQISKEGWQRFTAIIVITITILEMLEPGHSARTQHHPAGKCFVRSPSFWPLLPHPRAASRFRGTQVESPH